MDEVITLEPRHLGVKFRREVVRSEEWYTRAATRYVATLAKRLNWIWTAPSAELWREPAERCWYVYLSWEAADVPEAVNVHG